MAGWALLAALAWSTPSGFASAASTAEESRTVAPVPPGAAARSNALPEARQAAKPVDRAAAKWAYDEAVKLSEEGALEESLEAFHRAYDLAPHHAVLYNIGELNSVLGRPVEAVQALERYLAEGGNEISESDRSEAQRTLALNRRRVGTLRVTVQPADAVVHVDGLPWTPASTDGLRIAQGPHVVVAEREGHIPRVARVVVTGGEELPLSLVLQPFRGSTIGVEQGAQASSVETPGSERSPDPLAPSASPLLRMPRSALGSGAAKLDAPTSRNQRAVYVTGGLGVVLLGAGVAVRIYSQSRYEAWETSVASAVREDAPPSRFAVLSQEAADIQRLDDVGIGLAVGGALALGTCVYLWLTEDDASAQSRPHLEGRAAAASPAW